MGFGGVSEKGHALIRDGGSNYITETTNTVTDFNVISFAQDGSNLRVYFNGVKQTSYDTDTAGTRWFNTLPTERDNIVIGGRIRSTPVYTAGLWKGSIITDYVDDATVTSEATKILNSGL